jgi:prepilin-type N-terminal cleavage/methylation domain-containing protein
MRRAFTLIELLVVIAIISLLVSLFLPALAGARRTAKATVGFGNLRSLSQIMASYTNDHREAFLNPFRPVWPQTGDYNGVTWTMAPAINNPQQRWDFNSICLPVITEGFGGVWYSYLAEYRNGKRDDQEKVSPADPDLTVHFRNLEGDQSVREGETLMPTSFLYPPVFWSKPERFYGACRNDMKPELLQIQLLGSVLHPTAKVLLYERADFASGRTPLDLSSHGAKIHVATVDGSCDTVDMGALQASATVGTDLIATTYCDCPPGPPPPPQTFWATFRGVQGRDLNR